MPIKVVKPEFNLRSKLTELNVPVGTHGSQLMKSNDAAKSFDLVRAGRKNLIINGAMNINQRNGGSSVTVDGVGTYNLDRWCVHEATGGSVSVNMDGDPVNYPKSGVAQFTKAMQIACASVDTSVSSSENVHFFQNIEGHNCAHLQWGTDNAKPVTLSFWVKTNKEGIYSVGLENNNANRNCIREFFHDGTHKWQKFSMTYPGCIDGTWEQNNGLGIRVRFCLTSADQYGDGKDGVWVTTDELHAGRQTNFMDNTSNRFFITGVQLEEGTVATPFEHRLYPEELALCQRYFEVINLYGAHSNYTGGGYNRQIGEIHWKVEKRAVPTCNTPSVGNYQPGGGSGTVSISGPTIHGGVLNTGSTNSTYPDQWINSGAILQITSEL